MDNWKHKDEWKREGDKHTVVVSRHTNAAGDENRWCVYLYIYPGHPRFHLFKPAESAFDQPHYDCHSYVSFFRCHLRDAGSVGSYQLGWDYNHDGDYQYAEYETAEEAGSIFWDANKLFEEAAQ